jgi:hypothetical protein
MLNACMVMLTSAATQAAGLAHEGYDMMAFEHEVAGVSQQLQKVSHKRALEAQVTLPPSMKMDDLLGTYSPPAVALPLIHHLPDAVLSLEERQRRAAQNLGSYSLLTTTTFSKLVAALQQPWAETDLSYLHRLKSIERVLFGWVAAGISKASLTEPEVFALEQAVDIYSDLLHTLGKEPAGQAFMAQELRSRQVLVVWAAYCLMDASARHHHPERMAGYGVSLHWTDLRHLVLSDRAAVGAAQLVSDYLRSHHTGVASELFSLRDAGRATFRFAELFASQDARLQAVWRVEDRNADMRKSKHWDEVQRKQQQAQSLRRSLQQLRSHCDSMRSDLCTAQYKLNGINQYNYSGGSRRYNPDHTAAQNEVYRCQSEVSSLESSISAVQEQLHEAGKPPPPVIQPLPQQREKALVWLFFLHMPPLFRHLSRASFLAQQLMLPQPLLKDSMKAVKVAASDSLTSLRQHYNDHQACQYYTPPDPQTGADGKVHITSTEKVPDVNKLQPKHVDEFTSPSHGVWYPDTLQPQLTWMGSGSQADTVKDLLSFCFNPFAVLPAQGKGRQLTSCGGGLLLSASAYKSFRS